MILGTQYCNQPPLLFPGTADATTSISSFNESPFYQTWLVLQQEPRHTWYRAHKPLPRVWIYQSDFQQLTWKYKELAHLWLSIYMVVYGEWYAQDILDLYGSIVGRWSYDTRIWLKDPYCSSKHEKCYACVHYSAGAGWFLIIHQSIITVIRDLVWFD